jgi:ABC-2 type transport system ATP-binding protein
MRDSPSDAVVAVTSLSRRFGQKMALNDVSLKVPRGGVFGLVGENGAGKTTLIKHVLGLLRAETGDVRVFGLNPVSDPVAVLGRIGYLSEQPDLPDWMRVHEFMRYTRAFYTNWDAQYAERLRDQFGLDPAARVRVLSKGQRAKLGLLGRRRIVRICFCWMNRVQASILSFVKTSLRLSFVPLATKGARFSSPHIY